MHARTRAVDDPEFWEGISALEFGALPRLQDQVAVVGYPVGGESISITVGVVSRIEASAPWRFAGGLLCFGAKEGHMSARKRTLLPRARAPAWRHVRPRLCPRLTCPRGPAARRPQVTEYTHGSLDLLGVQIDAAVSARARPPWPAASLGGSVRWPGSAGLGAVCLRTPFATQGLAQQALRRPSRDNPLRFCTFPLQTPNLRRSTVATAAAPCSTAGASASASRSRPSPAATWRT
jgi:hypothetical protein